MTSIPRRSSLLNRRASYLHLDDHSEIDQHEMQTNTNSHTRASTASPSPIGQSSGDDTSLGKPSRKRMYHVMDIAAAFVALACLALSILVVSNDHLSWYLGTGNRQLIVIGFLLSIMNLCLGSVTPTFFLLLEARVGNSTLQNYDGILRNTPMASKLSFAWRMALVTMLALPVGLGAAYKTFTGGESSMKIHAPDYITNAMYFGLFRPPATASSMHGVSFFFNATNSFRDASERAANLSEPPLPTFPQAYGYNILLLNSSSAAGLDILDPNYILKIQKLLAPGESWNITASVLGTVATLNKSAATEEDFKSACNEMESNNTWYYESKDLFVGSSACSLSLTDRKGESDQSLQFVGLAPGNPNCTQYAPHNIYTYNIYRKPCRGTWSVSRGGFRLLEGSCDDHILDRDKQQVIQWQYSALPSWYTCVLIEMLRTFCLYPSKEHDAYRGNRSVWMMPYMSVSVATMMWSSTVSKQVTSFDSETFDKGREILTTQNKTILTFEEASIFYHIKMDEGNQTVIYTRPTLQTSPWLYLVLSIQPFLLLIFLGTIALLHTVPLDKGFGLISILSGVEHRGLDSLSGASLSGELKRPAKLTMSPVAPVQGDEKSTIKYVIDPSSEEMPGNKGLSRNVEYH
ncbi:hypothetical protein CCUS01_04794 [Colletotrichum cuscutae]|uniref:Uncharacterized protein n=1 Tax=Colletotrichum cuscutae TaxID=1209917 RepID=A0AAI9Y5G5_9PEZI|nr:hypothetical protein CCUS01_04794 [Colletotrichum cuscutae]